MVLPTKRKSEMSGNNIVVDTSIQFDFPLVTMDRDFNKVIELNTVLLEWEL